jgi:valyl-tRNA synthetase
MVNGILKQKTTLSDEEVIMKNNKKLYFLKYKIEGSEDFQRLQQHVLKLFFGDCDLY